MTADRIKEIETQWKEATKMHGEDAVSSLAIPVICSGSSTDAEHITKMLAIFMYTAQIMKKTTAHHEDYLFFAVAYTAPHERKFPAIQELYNRVRNAGGYYGSYRGILLADVSGWRGHFRDKYFDIFLAYLADQRTNGLIPFIYTDYCDSESEMQELEAVASSYFSVMRICVNAKDFCNYAVSLLKDQEIGIDESGRRYLEDFFQESKKSDLFHGTESVRHICKEVAGKFDPDKAGQSLDKDRLKAIITDLGYTEIYRERPGKIMGFR